MGKRIHEVRDCIHAFVKYDSEERLVLDSRPFQRLRHIHQLAMTYLVYPGATHRRFEHSLGVMELAGRVFDVVTSPDALNSQAQDVLPEITKPNKLRYWRRVLRVAALCHDLGHLPFSHAAETEMLPQGWDHERLTQEIVLSKEMQRIWSNMQPPIDPQHVVKLAVGPKKTSDMAFTDWESILADIITNDAFGVDRIDYLLRDSHHAGVPYGHVDHFRLIDTMRILPSLPAEKGDIGRPLALGIEEGGIHCAAALILARYFMYSQLYLHPIRRIYDIHLKDFLREWLPGGKFPTRINDFLKITDNEVNAALLEAARRTNKPGHTAASLIVRHQHFKELYRRNPSDVRINPEAGKAVFEAAEKEFGKDRVRHDIFPPKGGPPYFPVLAKDKRVLSSLAMSEALQHVPAISVDYVFVDPIIEKKARQWLGKNRLSIIEVPEEKLR